MAAAMLISSRRVIRGFTRIVATPISFRPRSVMARPEAKPLMELDKSLEEFNQTVRQAGIVHTVPFLNVLERVQKINELTSQQALLLLRCCKFLNYNGREEMLRIISQLWQDIKKKNVPLNVQMYNALLLLYNDLNHPVSAKDILEEMNSCGIQPDNLTYERLMLSCCQIGDIDGATKILVEMNEKNIPLTEKVFNALILGHTNANDEEHALKVLNLMENANITPSSETYGALMCCHAHFGKFSAISDILRTCKENSVTLDDKDLLNVVVKLVKNDMNEHVPEVIQYLQKQPGLQREIRSTFYKVCEMGKYEIAIELITSLLNDKSKVNLSYVFNVLVEGNVPSEMLVKLFNDIGGYVEKHTLSIITRTLLIRKEDEKALQILDLWNKDTPLQEFHFWPMLARYAKNKDIEAANRIFEKMNEYDIKITYPSVKYYLVPHFRDLDGYTLCTKLINDYKISEVVAKNIGLSHLISKGAIKESLVKFFKQYRCDFNINVLKHDIIGRLLKDNDFAVFDTITSQIGFPSHLSNEERNSYFNTEIPPPHMVGTEIMNTLIDFRESVHENTLQELLHYYFEKNWQIDSRTYHKLGRYMHERNIKLPPSTVQKLRAINDVNYVLTDEKNVSGKDLFNEIIHNSRRFNYQMVSRLLEKDLSKIPRYDRCIALATALSCFIKCNQHEEYKKFFKLLESNLDSQFEMNPRHVLYYAKLLLIDGREDDACKMIEKYPFSYNRTDMQEVGQRARQFVNVASNAGDVELTKRLIHVLTNCNYIEPNDQRVISPIVGAYINKGDVYGAVQEFQRAQEEYGLLPAHMPLFRFLIGREDAEALQTVTNICTKVKGQVATLHDLAFAFMECDKPAQAKKIFETPGLPLRVKMVEYYASLYYGLGRTSNLEKLLDLTSKFPGSYRDSIHFYLLSSYGGENNYQKALELYEKLKASDSLISPRFCSTLAEILRKNNQPIPSEVQAACYTRGTTPIITELEKGNVDVAVDMILEESKFSEVGTNIFGMLVDKALKLKSIDEVMEIVRKIHSLTKASPSVSALQKIATELSNADPKRIHEIKYLIKQESGEFRIFGPIYLKHGFVMDYLEMLKKCNNNTFDLKAVAWEPAVPIVEAFLKQPTYLETYKTIAVDWFMKRIPQPMNNVWCAYLINGQKEKAADVWNNYLVKQRLINIKPILQLSKNVDTLVQLTEFLDTHPNVNAETKRDANVALLCLYREQNMTDEAEALVRKMQGQNVIQPESVAVASN